MPSWALNNVTAPNAYSAASTLDGLPVVDHLNIDVSNGAIYWQLKQATGGLPESGTWQTEVFMFPGSRSIIREGIVGVRFRAAVPGSATPPQVTIEAVES